MIRNPTNLQISDRFKRLFSLAAVLCIITNLCFNQGIHWRSTPGPAGGTVQSFTSYGHNIFASMTSNGCIYHTSDNGKRWHVISPQNQPLASVVAQGSTLYAIGPYQTLFSTTDLGQTWETRSIQISGSPQLTSLWSFANKLYLGSVHGLFFSTNGGTSWLPAIFPDQIVEEIEQRGVYLYVGTNKGVQSSADAGSTYSLSPIGYVTALSSQDSVVYAGTESVFRSTNHGATWERRGSPEAGMILSLAATNSILIAGTQSGGVRISNDSGLTWTNSNLLSEYVYALLVKDSIVFAGTRYDGVSMSIDGGESWQEAPVYGMSIQAIDAFESVLFAAQRYSSNVYRSTNAGQSWSTIPLPTDFVFDFAIGDGKLYAGVHGGVFASTDGGLTWTLTGHALNTSNVFSVAYSAGHLFAGTGGMGVFVSTDEGVTWSAGYGLAGNEYVYDLLIVRSIAFAAATNGVYVSTDQGVSWERHTPVGSSYALGAVDSIVFASGYFSSDKVIRSADFGKTWVDATSGLTDNATYPYEFATHHGELFVGTNNGVFRSSDLGNQWIPFNDSLQGAGQGVFRLTADARNIYAGTLNNGIWWRPFEAAFLGMSHEPIVFRDVFIGSSANASLSLMNTGSVALTVYSVHSDNPHFTAQPSTLVIPAGGSGKVTVSFAPTDLGQEKATLVIRTDAFYPVDSIEVRGLGGVSNDFRTLDGIPDSYYLEQNFPNPFNSTTTIRFGVPCADHVQVTVFDIKGERVAVVTSEDTPAGNYELHWNVEGLSSGVYFLQLSSPRFVATKKLLYLK